MLSAILLPVFQISDHPKHPLALTRRLCDVFIGICPFGLDISECMFLVCLLLSSVCLFVCTERGALSIVSSSAPLTGWCVVFSVWLLSHKVYIMAVLCVVVGDEVNARSAFRFAITAC